MKKYKITDIIEDEFGCEGRPEAEVAAEAEVRE